VAPGRMGARSLKPLTSEPTLLAACTGGFCGASGHRRKLARTTHMASFRSCRARSQPTVLGSCRRCPTNQLLSFVLPSCPASGSTLRILEFPGAAGHGEQAGRRGTGDQARQIHAQKRKPDGAYGGVRPLSPGWPRTPEGRIIALPGADEQRTRIQSIPRDFLLFRAG
jgi:hypothetical protein